jgi:hypothetical protein
MTFIQSNNTDLMFYSNKPFGFFNFYRFNWLSRYLRSVRLNSNVFIATLEPSLDDEALKLCFCQGVFVSALFNLNSISVTLKQIFGPVIINRTFLLNSSNFVYFRTLN